MVADGVEIEGGEDMVMMGKDVNRMDILALSGLSLHLCLHQKRSGH